MLLKIPGDRILSKLLEDSNGSDIWERMHMYFNFQTLILCSAREILHHVGAVASVSWTAAATLSTLPCRAVMMCYFRGSFLFVWSL